ncbi:hypothetical protein SNEBB_008473 [Seison nebaliae]|nr:hypothetical protein SNEBB_008473 [Seison nebaliae]
MSKTSEFFGVYLLCNENVNAKIKNTTYIGYTVNPGRRIDQHNGGISQGGANKTNMRGPWRMILTVHGFPNDTAALKFEWAWQNPEKSRRVKHLMPSTSRLQQMKLGGRLKKRYKLFILQLMLTSNYWRRLSLTLQWLSINEEDENDIHLVHSLPKHMVVISGPYKNRLIDNKIIPSYDREDKCLICKGKTETTNDDTVECPISNCNGLFHIFCLSKLFLKDEPNQLLPIGGKCPQCSIELRWGDIIQSKNCKKFIDFQQILS